MKRFLSCAVVLVLACNAWADVSNFSDLSLAPGSYWNGVDGGTGGGYGTMTSTPFTSGVATYNNQFWNDGYGDTWWAGWSYSNLTASTYNGKDFTATSQYTAIPGGGVAGPGSNYGVAYVDVYDGVLPTVTLASPSVVSGIYVTNTEYAYWSMTYGDSFAKQFGPEDWFLLTVTGINAVGNPTGSVNFYLADNGSIVDSWQNVNLSSLGVVSSLEFNLSSSDNFYGYMNTPAYFALGEITTAPEPGTLGLLCLGGLALIRRRKTGKGETHA